MGAKRPAVASQIEAVYREGPKDPDFATILARVVAHDDEEIAEAIEVDGRTRIMSGRPVDLRRYLDGVPTLATSELALDAAIDVTLRYRSKGPRPTPRAVQSLIADYPILESAISEAALLAEAVVSTSGVGRIVRSSPQREVPADFGPVIGKGRCRYQLVRLLGSGSTGEVYQAIDRQLSERDRPAYVAIKLLAGRGRGAQARQVLAEEATKARRVLHDNVVRVLDRGVSDQDEDYIVYEHVPGGDLDAWFEKQRWEMQPLGAARMLAQIARGVQAAHSAGLVHCDLKPSNVLISEAGAPKVCDFGIAVRKSDLARGSAKDHKPIGNIAFISPEQFRGEEGCLNPPSDVYALGGILFYLLTHEYPNGASIDAVARTHDALNGRAQPPSPRASRREVDQDLDAICRRAMSVKPADRYASAAALADDLDAWVRREPIRWTEPSVWRVASLAARRRPVAFLAWALAGAAVLGGAVGVGYWVSVANDADRTVRFAREQVGNMLRWMRSLPREGREQDLLPILSGLEAVSGPAVFATRENQVESWNLRISIARTLVDDATKAGRGSDVETLLWQGLEGLWLLNANQVDEAERVLNDNARRWVARQTPDDHWPRQIQLLAASAAVRRISQASSGRALTGAERAELASFEPLFRQEPDIFVGRSQVSPMRRPVLDALIQLYGPQMLNDPEAMSRAKQERIKAEPR